MITRIHTQYVYFDSSLYSNTNIELWMYTGNENIRVVYCTTRKGICASSYQYYCSNISSVTWSHPDREPEPDNSQIVCFCDSKNINDDTNRSNYTECTEHCDNIRASICVYMYVSYHNIISTVKSRNNCTILIFLISICIRSDDFISKSNNHIYLYPNFIFKTISFFT